MEAHTYAEILYNNRITEELLPELSKETLKELGITIMGDVLAILRVAKHSQTTINPSLTEHTNRVKAPSALIGMSSNISPRYPGLKFTLSYIVVAMKMCKTV